MQFSFQFKAKNLILLSLVTFSSAFAIDGHFYLNPEFGKSFATLSDANPQIDYYAIYPDAPVTDSYPLNNNHSSTSVLGLNAGYEFVGHGAIPNIAVGIGWYHTPNTYHFTGQVAENYAGYDIGTLYNYQFRIASMRVMAETRFTWSLAHHLMPYLDFGIGPAWNHVGTYQETVAAPNGTLANSGFQSNTNNNLAYQVGGGIGYELNPHNRLSVGYRFVDLGQASLNGRDSTYPYSLQPGRLTTNDVYLGFTHLF